MFPASLLLESYYHWKGTSKDLMLDISYLLFNKYYILYTVAVCFAILDISGTSGFIFWNGIKCARPASQAPEMFEGERITESVDIYSFGILLWECYTGEFYLLTLVY